MTDNNEPVQKETIENKNPQPENIENATSELKNARDGKPVESRQPRLMSYQTQKWGPYCGRSSGR